MSEERKQPSDDEIRFVVKHVFGWVDAGLVTECRELRDENAALQRDLGVAQDRVAQLDHQLAEARKGYERAINDCTRLEHALSRIAQSAQIAVRGDELPPGFFRDEHGQVIDGRTMQQRTEQAEGE